MEQKKTERANAALYATRKHQVDSNWWCIKSYFLESIIIHDVCILLWNTELYEQAVGLVHHFNSKITVKHQGREENQGWSDQVLFLQIESTCDLTQNPSQYFFSSPSPPFLVLFVPSILSTRSLVPAEWSATSYCTSQPLLCWHSASVSPSQPAPQASAVGR